jgi:Tetratricopeptide repeat
MSTGSRGAYDVVWWITSDPPQFIDSALSDLSAQLHLPEEPTALDHTRAVLTALAKGEPYDRWLVVFDNADDIDGVRAFLPDGPGHTLLTSRNLQWRDQTTTMPIDVFARRESITHLRRRLRDISTEDANRVAEALGDLPIAISAASAWLADTGTPVEAYLEEIRSRGARAVPAESESAPSVQTTWNLSLDRLRERSPGAYRLLQLCSVLAPDIAQQLVYSDEMGGALRGVSARSSERMERGKLVQDITRLALLKLDAQNLHVHRLLQHVVRDRMSDDELLAARHAVHVVLAAARPRGEVDDPELWGQFRVLWPHLEVSGAMNCPDEAVRELLVDRVRYLWLRGAYRQGEETALRIEEVWRALLPTLDRPEVQAVLRRQLLSLRFNLANMLREQGRFAESRGLNEAVRAEQVTLLGENSPYTLMTSSSLSADLRALGLYEEALTLDRHTYAAWARDYGDDYYRTLSAENNLAASLRLLGDFRSAEKHDREVYQRRRLVLGPQNPYTLYSASAVGRDLREAGEYERSVELLREVLQSCLAAFGQDARATLNARTNLAVSLRSAGRPDEATELLEVAYERLLENAGADSPDTLACRLSRASNILARGDLEHARREMESVTEAYESRLGPRHPHTITCVNNMAVVERAAGGLLQARQLAEVAAERYLAALPAQHPYILAAGMNAAVFLAELGEAEKALPALDDLLERLAERLGADHPDTLRCEANRVLVLARAGRPGPGTDESDLERRLKNRFGSRHPAVAAFAERNYVHRVLDPHPF